MNLYIRYNNSSSSKQKFISKFYLYFSQMLNANLMLDDQSIHKYYNITQQAY